MIIILLYLNKIVVIVQKDFIVIKLLVLLSLCFVDNQCGKLLVEPFGSFSPWAKWLKMADPYHSGGQRPPYVKLKLIMRRFQKYMMEML